MKWQKLVLITFIMIVLIAPVSAFYGNSTNYQIRGIFGGSGDVANGTNYQISGLATNQQPTWRQTTLTDFFVAGIYPFGLSCFAPTNDTAYDIGTDITNKDITICPGTYSNVTFVMSMSDVTLNCAGSTFNNSNVGTWVSIPTGTINTEIYNCNVYNYNYGISNGGSYGLFYDNNFSYNYIGVRNTPVSTDNLVYNNYLSNNSFSNGQEMTFGYNSWNAPKDCYSGFNIIGGLCKGGNYYDDYAGIDTNFDGIGDTEIPYSETGEKDQLPLTNLHELPDAGFLAISFILGFFSIAFILAWLSTTLGISSRMVTRKSFGDYGMGIDIEDNKDYNHWPLRIYFLLACMLTIVADLHIIAALERDYLSSLGDLTYALVDKLPYVILIVPIFYLLITILHKIFKNMKDNKDAM